MGRVILQITVPEMTNEEMVSRLTRGRNPRPNPNGNGLWATNPTLMGLINSNVHYYMVDNPDTTPLITREEELSSPTVKIVEVSGG